MAVLLSALVLSLEQYISIPELTSTFTSLNAPTLIPPF